MKERLFRLRKFLDKKDLGGKEEDEATKNENVLSPTDLMNQAFGGGAVYYPHADYNAGTFLTQSDTGVADERGSPSSRRGGRSDQNRDKARTRKDGKSGKLVAILPTPDTVWKKIKEEDSKQVSPNNAKRSQRCGLCELEFSAENLATRITQSRVDKLRSEWMASCTDPVLLAIDWRVASSYDKVALCAFCREIAKFHVDTEKV
ncbi:unnamed protein product [Amoebophrya sp. A25]|nr:unnamed protein product [Amoebophrya sp. A25]|eukprot:GSA25T00020064001.1